jgi:hypothetical protein
MSGDKEGGDRKGESGSQWKKLLHELVWVGMQNQAEQEIFEPITLNHVWLLQTTKAALPSRDQSSYFEPVK